MSSELLISLIEERDVLWDKTLEIYKDKRKTVQAWHEICTILIEGFETMPDVEKNKQGKILINKWKNMRDAWMRCHKKLSEYKSGSGAKPVHKYTYYENMKFLMKISEHRQTESNMSSIPATAEVSAGVNANKRKKTFSSGIEKKMENLIDSIEKEESPIMSFFRGIAPTVEKFNDEDVVEFQFQVMSIIRNTKNKNRILISTDTQQPYSYNMQPPITPSTQSYSYNVPDLTTTSTQLYTNTELNPKTSSTQQIQNRPLYETREESQGYGYCNADTSASREESHNYSSDQQSTSYCASPSDSSVDLDFAVLKNVEFPSN